LEGEDATEFGLVPNPSILVTLELESRVSINQGKSECSERLCA